jgi:hypothetical protein
MVLSTLGSRRRAYGLAWKGVFNWKLAGILTCAVNPKSTGSIERTTLYQSSDSGQHRRPLLVRIYPIIFVQFTILPSSYRVGVIFFVTEGFWHGFKCHR